MNLNFPPLPDGIFKLSDLEQRINNERQQLSAINDKACAAFVDIACTTPKSLAHLYLHYAHEYLDLYQQQKEAFCRLVTGNTIFRSWIKGEAGYDSSQEKKLLSDPSYKQIERELPLIVARHHLEYFLYGFLTIFPETTGMIAGHELINLVMILDGLGQARAYYEQAVSFQDRQQVKKQMAGLKPKKPKIPAAEMREICEAAYQAQKEGEPLKDIVQEALEKYKLKSPESLFKPIREYLRTRSRVEE